MISGEASMQITDWIEEIEIILKKVDDVKRTLDRIMTSFSSCQRREATVLYDLVAKGMPTVENDVDEIRKAGAKLREAYFLPNSKFINGLPLTSEDFNLLLSQGIISMHRDDLNDYEVFMLYYYKDDRIEGYICPSEEPPRKSETGKCWCRLSLAGEVAPGNVRISYLSKQQRDYFGSILPELYSRFRRE